ncbi:MAG TPA: nucleotidyltransferase domain-containing protein [Pseudonocardiaceae bacterium]|jgi:hypothetical protein|nr:nucleotidyltransferase domain-containing protein [Pseudonocardiaceae bacterium]
MDENELVAGHTVLDVIVGDGACGLADPEVPGDDPPRRAVYVAPTESFWRLDKPPASVSGPGVDTLSWEIETCCALGLAADPAVFDALGSPLTQRCTEVGEELRALLPALLSQRAADAYRRATATEFARASAAMAGGGTPRWRQVAEVIRLLIGCEHLLRTGELVADVSKYRDELLAVRAGDMAWSDASSWVESLRDRSAEAVLRSPLPVTPDTGTVQDWLSSVRRRHLG